MPPTTSRLSLHQGGFACHRHADIVAASFPPREHRGLSRLAPKSIRSMLFGCGMLTLVVWLAGSHVGAAPLPTAEFDVPVQVLRVLSNGTVLELSGSFSWALPQNVQAILAGAPGVRVVRLESPGGHVLPALQVATIIQQRGLDTYVGRLCASACTVAFLGGRQRWLASDARLGFHQAHAPGVPPDQANAFLQAAYEKFAVPPPFVAHVLRTPPADLWYPTQQDLRAAHYTTGDPPDSVLSLGRSPLPRLSDFTRLLRTAPDDAVIQFATAFSDLIGPHCRKRIRRPADLCSMKVPDDPQDALSQTVLDAGFAAAQQRRQREAARTTQAAALDPAQRKQAEADLLAAIRAKGQLAALEGLRSGADHAAFCPSLRDLLQAALGLPDTHRGTALRAVLSGG